jgi:toxin ParE1/3/4
MTHYWISPLAEQDMEAIGDFIAQDNPHRAQTFITELRNQCTRIAAAPMPKQFDSSTDSPDSRPNNFG